MSEVHAELSKIETQLTRAAEMCVSGALDQEMYDSMVLGVLTRCPLLPAPKHIVVLRAVKEWGDAELLSDDVYKLLVDRVIKASHPHEEDETASSSTTVRPAESATRGANAKEAGAKKARLDPGQRSIFDWKGVERQRVLKDELRKQREAALRNVSYEVETHLVIRFPTESKEREETHTSLRQCPKCARTFETAVGLNNHVKWHSETVKDKLFTPRPDLPEVVGCELRVDEETGEVALDISIEGKTRQRVRMEIIEAATAAESARAERVQRQITEAERRRQARETADREQRDEGEQRKGSARRGSFTAKMKLKVWLPLLNFRL